MSENPFMNGFQQILRARAELEEELARYNASTNPNKVNSMSQSVQGTLSERANSHGSFIDNGLIMQTLKDLCREGKNWDSLPPHQKEAIDMICHKLGRILCGNNNHTDHWHDIAGYATLCENLISSSSHSPKS